MFDPTTITLDDITSEPKVGLDYIHTVDVYRGNYEAYQPNEAILTQIVQWMDAHEEKLRLIAFGATWCGDCKQQLPRLVKIEKKLGDPRFTVGVLGGIKVKPPYAREKGKLIWKSPPSPPEALDVRFDMFHIPAIFIFAKDGHCLGKIDEKPEHKQTLEEEILYYLQK